MRVPGMMAKFDNVECPLCRGRVGHEHCIAMYGGELRKLAPATLRLYHATLGAALRSAVKQGLLGRNVAPLVEGLPKVERGSDALAANCWSLTEARTFLATAKAAGPRPAAFYALALDSGARISELAGLKWSDVDFEAGRLTIQRQLISSKLGEDGQPQFGPPKAGRARVIDLNAETIRLLKAHRQHQSELKMANRRHYADLGLMFAKEQQDIAQKRLQLGTPIQLANIRASSGEFAKLLRAANVKRVTFHGCRHTSATLLLLAGEPAKIVSERLGHSTIGITLDTYSHVLPGMQQRAAAKLGALLHG